MDSARKNTQARETRQKVVNNRTRLRNPLFGSSPIARQNRSRAGAVAWPKTRKKPWSPPHATKVQFAPCHSPLIRNTNKIFAIQRATETRFPPKLT